jgi:hypothetical protein
MELLRCTNFFIEVHPIPTPVKHYALRRLGGN